MTLIEIMIVVVIMSMVAAAMGIGVMSAKKTADIKLAQTTLRTVRNVAETYQITRTSSECPSMQQLVDSKLMSAGASTDDPWGKPYELSCETGEVNVRSSGPDGERGTEDDLALLKEQPDGA
jgi:type II secretory pathway pseudopilin PulG